MEKIENIIENIIEKKLIKERPDSFEFGDTKVGKCKIYVNVDDKEDTEERIKKGIELVKKYNKELRGD